MGWYHRQIFAIRVVLDLFFGPGRVGRCHRSVMWRVYTSRMIPVRPVELALHEVLTETNAGVEVALDALARVVATTLVESGDYAAARRFYELLEAALMREG